MKDKKIYQADGASKREKILEEKRKTPLPAVIVLSLAAAILLAWFIFQDSPSAGSGSGAGAQIMEKVSYRNQTIAMTRIEALLVAGSISIPVDLVKEKKLVSFDYASGKKQVPLMAYITPTGKLVTAVSMCEPCKSTKFHIEDEQMVCNACGTRWTLEGLQGISGGCLAYPPDVMANSVRDGKIKINEKIVLNWKPRV